MKKSVHMAINNKGGIGKSLLMRSLAHYFRVLHQPLGINTALLDYDLKNKSLTSMYGQRDAAGNLLPSGLQDIYKGVKYYDIRNEKDRDYLVNMLNLDTGVILIDSPGGTVEQLYENFDGPVEMIREYNSEGFEVVFHIPITHVASTIMTIRELHEMFADTSAQYVVWKNLGTTDPDDFVLFDKGLPQCRPLYGDAYAADYCAQNGILVRELNKMKAGRFAKLDMVNKPFHTALQDPIFERVEAKHIRTWASNMCRTLDETMFALGIKEDDSEGVSDADVESSLP